MLDDPDCLKPLLFRMCVTKLLRDGKEIESECELHPNDLLVPVHTFDKLPSYLIYAGVWGDGTFGLCRSCLKEVIMFHTPGLVFVPLSQPYLHEYGEDW